MRSLIVKTIGLVSVAFMLALIGQPATADSGPQTPPSQAPPPNLPCLLRPCRRVKVTIKEIFVVQDGDLFGPGELLFRLTIAGHNPVVWTKDGVNAGQTLSPSLITTYVVTNPAVSGVSVAVFGVDNDSAANCFAVHPNNPEVCGDSALAFMMLGINGAGGSFQMTANQNGLHFIASGHYAVETLP